MKIKGVYFKTLVNEAKNYMYLTVFQIRIRMDPHRFGSPGSGSGSAWINIEIKGWILLRIRIETNANPQSALIFNMLVNLLLYIEQARDDFVVMFCCKLVFTITIPSFHAEIE
jgi:hypothetical protein